MPRPRPRYLVPVAALALLAAGFFAPRDDDFFALRKNFQIFGAIYEELAAGYVDPLDPQRLMRAGIESMLEDLDPYTVFFDEAANSSVDVITQGRYGGVGLNLGERDGRLTVTSPVEGTSGYKQGVRTGDVVTHIAGQPTDELTMHDVHTLLRGEPGTAVEIVVEREGEPEPLRFLLTREAVQVKSVSYQGFAADGIAYVKLDRFGREAGAEVRQALQALQQQALQQQAPLKGVLLDLRDNPGGLLDAAVEISELFVPQGAVIVSTKGRAPGTERTYRSRTVPLLPEVPLVVLVNGLSASASEIVAGAVQDLDRGLVVGTTTYGKGLVQIVRPLPYNTSLKLTTSKYFTPSGRSIQAIDYGRHDGNANAIPDSLRRTYRTAAGRAVQDGRGIEPDVAAPPGSAGELEAALDRRAAFFFFANHYAAQHPTLPDGFEVTDALLADFRAWLAQERFTYRTAAERAADALTADLDAAAYDGALDEARALAEAIRKEKEADFARHAAHLKARLRTEILARYYGQQAQVEASLRYDPQVLRSLALLRDADTYTRALRPR